MDAIPSEPLPPFLPDPDGGGASLAVRTGSALAAGVVAAIVASLPAALRTGGLNAGLMAHWVVLSAVSVPLTVAAVALLRRARVGLCLVAGERVHGLALGVLGFSVVQMALLSVFAIVLKKTTHHQALAGVTFAVFAAVTSTLVALLAWRMTDLLARKGARTYGFMLAGGVAFAVLVVVALRMAHAEGAQVGAALVDGLAFGIASLLASSRSVASARRAALAAIPVAVVLIAVGFTMLRFDEGTYDLIAAGAPVHRSLIGLFGG